MSDSNSCLSGLFGVLGIVFVTLKLCDLIDWSWWWVTAPFWGPIAILVALALVLAMFACCVTIYDHYKK